MVLATMNGSPSSFGRGSLWHRWDPHIHAPGTILEDEFEGPDAWEEYLVRIETATPTVAALGITDYWSIDLYERVVAAKAEDRLPNVELIFANVEMRLGIATGSGSAVNAHLLISPEDPDHVAEARRFLSSLTFKAKKEVYGCTREDLIRLGRAHEKGATEDGAALRVGTNQFKTTAPELKKALDDSEWAQKNIVVAVAATTGSGTSGMKGDASMASTRQEIERLAGVIFSGTPSDRVFWLGEGADSLSELRDSTTAPNLACTGRMLTSTSGSARRTWTASPGSRATLALKRCVRP